MTQIIQLDAAFSFQQAALIETYRVLRQTHGEAFAANFMEEYKEQVLLAARKRLCGRSEAWLCRETKRLRGGGLDAAPEPKKFA